MGCAHFITRPGLGGRAAAAPPRFANGWLVVSISAGTIMRASSVRHGMSQPHMPELYSLHRLTINAPGEALFAALSVAIPGLSRHQARQAVSAWE